MKYSFLNKRITFGILLFYFTTLQSQNITVINATLESVMIENSNQSTKLNSGSKKEFSGVNSISIKGSKLSRTINIFLEPKEKLSITIEKDNKLLFNGDHSFLHEYISENLNADLFGKIQLYEQIGEKKNFNELKTVSELLLADILKKVKLPSIIVSPEDNNSTKRLKSHIKYNWLSTLFTTFNRRDKAFRKEALNYYYKKYIETDIKTYRCNNFLDYSIIEALAKNKDLLQVNLPTYPIIEHTEDDTCTQYLPISCQKQYFIDKYNYLEHINGHNKDYYKRILVEKFNDQ